MDTEKKKGLSLEQGMYIVGIIFLVIGIPFLIFYMATYDKGIYPECIMYRHFGIYCPGCGGSRAVAALLGGDIISSIIYHPVVIYSAVIYVVFMGSQTLSLLSRHKIKGILFHYWFLYGALILIIINFIVKNVLKFGFHIILM